jgi:hypothetical protein
VKTINDLAKMATIQSVAQAKSSMDHNLVLKHQSHHHHHHHHHHQSIPAAASSELAHYNYANNNELPPPTSPTTAAPTIESIQSPTTQNVSSNNTNNNNNPISTFPNNNLPQQQAPTATSPTTINQKSKSSRKDSNNTDRTKLITKQRSTTRANSTSSISSGPAGPKANWVIHKDWKLRKLLGSGAYGEVYQAVELRTGSKVAIKLDMRNNSEMEREIEYLKKLNGQSEYIPQILEYGRFSGISYFVMTLLGKNLSDLKRKRMNRKFTLSTVLLCSFHY